MKFNKIALYTVVAGSAFVVEIVKAQGQMVKMCLFYGNPSGHARSDPIINQQCSSGHVHTVSSILPNIKQILLDNYWCIGIIHHPSSCCLVSSSFFGWQNFISFLFFCLFFQSIQFYGPLGFHPDTTYQDLISTPPELSTSPYVENQSLYWVRTLLFWC